MVNVVAAPVECNDSLAKEVMKLRLRLKRKWNVMPKMIGLLL